MSKKIILAVIIAIVILAIGFGLGILGSQKSSSLGSTSYDVNHFAGDIYQGMADVLQISGGFIVGPVRSGSATTAGCLEVGNGSSLSYLTVTSSTVAVTSTKPTVCK